MIRRGRAEGWFQLPSASFRLWIKHNEIQFAHTVPGAVDGKGSALLAEECLDDNKNDYATVLMVVPKDLILSLGRVQEHAKEDKEFREVLESLGDFGRVSTMIYVFSRTLRMYIAPAGVYHCRPRADGL